MDYLKLFILKCLRLRNGKSIEAFYFRRFLFLSDNSYFYNCYKAT